MINDTLYSDQMQLSIEDFALTLRQTSGCKQQVSISNLKDGLSPAWTYVIDEKRHGQALDL